MAAAGIPEKLVMATFAVAMMATCMDFAAAAFSSAAYNCVEVNVPSGSDLYKARRRVLDDMVDSRAPESNAYYCTTSTSGQLGDSKVYGYATCDSSKLSRCNDCLSYGKDFLDDICEYSIGGQVVVGDGVCSMQFDARPISPCLT